MERRKLAILLSTLVGLWVGILAIPGQSQEVPGEYQMVLNFLGRQGDFKNNVLKVSVPRSDLEVTIKGNPIPTALGFGGWIGMTENEAGIDVMMGDLVLLQEEVNPVMSALLENGLEVTALHNHFFWEEPRIFYMHIYGEGKPADLARRVKPALDLIGKSTSPGQAGRGNEGQLDTAKIAQIVGHVGTQNGPVYKITIGRDDFVLEEMGAVINARMGLNTWAAFAGTDEDAVIAGDVAMLEGEVTPVLKALRKNGLEVVAIHHHMLALRPMNIFLHYWGTGPAKKLAEGFKAAIDELGKRPRTTKRPQ